VTVRRVVVAGFGMAAARFLDALPSGWPGAVTVVGAEPYPAYNRVLLTDVVAGRADPDALSLPGPSGHAARGVDVRLARHVVDVDLPPGRDGGAVRLDDGSRIAFDRLVLATGAAPVVPDLAGLDLPTALAGIHPLRTLDDARAIVVAAGDARRAVVLGGGPLGLEVACGLARRGLDVQLLQAAAQLLPGILDAAAGGVLARALGRIGVGVRTGTTATEVTGAAGRLTGVVLRGGACLPADLLVPACGVRPRTALAVRCGLAVRRGVLVDATLATGDPRVLAIGDCAEHDGRVPGLVAVAWEQARVAAALLGGDPRARYRAPRPAVRLKAAGVDVTAVGESAVDVWADEPGLHVAQHLDPAHGRYVKAVIRAGTVTGAAVVGDARAAAELRLLVERGSPAPEHPAGPAPGAATVCRCNGVTRDVLRRAWAGGARTPADLARVTRATTGCGGCADEVRELADVLAR